MKILVVNAGSSSHKLSLYHLEGDEPVAPLWQGAVDWGREDMPPSYKAETKDGAKLERELPTRDILQGLKTLVETLWTGPTQVVDGPGSIESIGHRVVHGGLRFEEPVVIDQQVKDEIRKLIPLAPLHNPSDLEGIELMEKLFPSVKQQVAVFDTAFHVTMPDIVKTYPVPLKWKEEKGILRYGFHGISHQYCSERAAKFLEKDPAELKIINCHLGNGCSLCAILGGKSYETTMGLTPMEGLMMGTRCGSIDPGILLYLLREHQFSLDDLNNELNFKSGLKGISGFSDMRELMDRRAGDEHAALAIAMFVHRLKRSIGALAMSLDGFDVLSFTAGIGEHSSAIREEVCLGLQSLGLKINLETNRTCRPDAEITADGSLQRVLVIKTQEEWMIARVCKKLCAG